jgi:Xaa-Pro aminopeptidase
MRPVRRLAVVLIALSVVAVPLSGQRTGYPAAEFTARRQQLAARLDPGLLILFSNTSEPAGLKFRQDHDFYYLTGSEDLNAVLVMETPGGATHVFVPRLPASTVLFSGGNWLDEPESAARHGVASVRPISELEAFLAARKESGVGTVWARLGPADVVDRGRQEIGFEESARRRNPLAQYPGEAAQRTQALRDRFPGTRLEDVTPHLDRLRLIKSPREVEILRRNGRISAEAVGRAIGISQPGRYEYEFEAEARYWLVRHGVQADAYPAIVGSGPNGNQWHYVSNGRRTEDGDLVVMDYGGSLDYLTIDITRTWPVSGRFSPEQRRAYECVLEAQLAMIALMRPGTTRQALREAGERVFRNRGFDPRYAYTGHYVGMSVHDVGDWALPLEAGMVLAIEPILDLPAERLHIRVEDTVLITDTGVEVLTAAVPKQVEELLALATSSARQAVR